MRNNCNGLRLGFVVKLKACRCFDHEILEYWGRRVRVPDPADPDPLRARIRVSVRTRARTRGPLSDPLFMVGEVV